MLHFLSLKLRSVPVLESYGVGIDFILRRDNKVCRDVCECLVPAGEGVPNASRVGGCFCVAAVLHFLSLKLRSVPVLESYGVGIDFILRRDNKVCRDVCECLVPAGEGVPNASRVGGCFCVAAVLYLLSLKHRSVPVLECDGVGVNAVLCRNNEVCGNICECLVPTGEGVAHAGRVCGGCCRAAVLYLLSLKHRAVPILKCYGVAVDAVLRGNNEVCGNIGECLVPTREGVARAGRVCGSCCRFTMFNLLRLQHRSVPILECDCMIS